MAWPLSQDYNEAIQSPATSFSDPELKAGQPVTNALGIPQPRSGNFADVYEFDCPRTQSKWAIKCFTREIRGLQERYAEISRFLESAHLPFAVEFHYLEQGVRIRGAWYPILKMRWVEGLLLNDFVRDNLDKPARLRALLDVWLRMSKRLREAQLAHADLQHGNVILVPGSKDNSLAIKLIDYDGMFVPALAGKPSGEVGHPNYQHPQRLKEGIWSREVDRFPCLVVATALRALTLVGPKLWEHFDNGDNLLFKETDLRSPEQSPVFKELARIGDQELRSLLEQLQRATTRPLEECPLLEEPAPAKAPPPAKATARNTGATPAFDLEKPAKSDARKKHPRTQRDHSEKSATPLIAAVGGGVVALGLVIGLVAWAMRPAPAKQRPSTPIAAVSTDGGKKKQKKNPAPGRNPTTPKGPPKVPQQPPEEPVGEVARFADHGGDVRRVAWSADGKRILSASGGDNLVRVFGVPGLQVLHELKGHSAGVTGVACYPKGNKVMTCSIDKTVQVWDREVGSWLLTNTMHKDVVHSVAISADGMWAASCGRPNTVLLWDLPGGKQVELTGHKATVEGVAFSPKGDRLLTGDESGVIHVWQLSTGTKERTLVGHTGVVSGIRITPDGRYALSCGMDKTIRLWSLRSGKELKRYEGHTDPVSGLDLSPDGRRFLSCGGDRTIRLWDVETGKVLHQFEGHTGFVWDVAFSPTGWYAVSGSADKSVRLWRLPDPDKPSDKPLNIPEPETPENPFDDGERRFEGHTGPVYAVAISPDGKRVLSGGSDKTVRMWDRTTGKQLWMLENTGHMMEVAFSPNGKRIVIANANDPIRLCDAQTGKDLVKYTGHPGGLKAVAFSSDGRRLISCGDDNTMRLWDVATGAQLRRFDHPSWVRRTAFSPDGGYAVSSCEDGNVRVWSLQTGKEYRRLQGRGDLYSCAFCNDGRRVLAGSFDKNLRLWDIASGRLLHTLGGDGGRIWGLAVSPNDKYALSCSDDKTVRLWDLTTGMQIKQFAQDCRHSIGFSRDGKYGVCGGEDGVVRVWRLPVDDAGPAGEPKEKPSLPSADDQKAAEKEIKERFQVEYLLKAPAARTELATKLRQEGLETTDNPTHCFVYLREAGKLAALAGNLPLIASAADDLAFLFATNTVAEKLAWLKIAAVSAADQAAIATTGLEWIQEALTVDAYDTAAALGVVARSAGVKANNPALVGRARRLNDRISYLRKEYATVQKAVATLTEKPGDPDASLELGKFYCYRKEDWDRGLPLLAAGNDTDLQALARKDMAGATAAPQQADLGHGWWDLAAKETGVVRAAIQRRARMWFYSGLPRLAAADRDKVEEKLALRKGKIVRKPGLVTELFSDEGLKNKVKTRLDYQVEFNWGFGSPAAGVPADHFSVRWQGWLVVPRRGQYTLFVHADDGARLFVDRKLLIDGWTKIGRHTMTVALDEKPHHLQIEFREGVGTAMMVFGYAPEGSGGQAVPPGWLYHDEEQRKLLAR